MQLRLLGLLRNVHLGLDGNENYTVCTQYGRVELYRAVWDDFLKLVSR